MKAASHSELQVAKTLLSMWGYDASFHENGHLIVQDPVSHSPVGGKDGMLVFDGFRPVAIRSYIEARRFVNARN